MDRKFGIAVSCAAIFLIAATYLAIQTPIAPQFYFPAYKKGEIIMSFYQGNWTAKVVGTTIQFSNQNKTIVEEWIISNGGN